MKAQRIAITVGAAAGGVLAAAFLQSAVAVADTPVDVLPGDIAWVPDNDPGFAPLLSMAPLFQTFASEDTYKVDLYPAADATAGTYPYADLYGQVGGDAQYTTFLGGASNLNYVVSDWTTYGQNPIPDNFVVPTDGSVYDIFNFGGGYENVYTDIVGVGDAANTINDTFVTPFGDFDLSSLFGNFDAAQSTDSLLVALSGLSDAFDQGALGGISAAADASAGAVDGLSGLFGGLFG